MKLRCKLFGHKWVYYKTSKDDDMIRVCKNCGDFAYKKNNLNGWIMGFLQSSNKEKE